MPSFLRYSWRALVQAIARRLAAVTVACLIALGLSWVSDAHAQYAPSMYSTSNFPTPMYPTRDEACQVRAAAYPGSTFAVVVDTTYVMCRVTASTGGFLVNDNILYQCEGSAGKSVLWSALQTPCANPPPPPPPTCNVPAGTTINQQQYVTETDTKIAPSLDFCATQSQCTLTASGRTASQNLTTGKWETVWFGPFKTTGDACNSNGAGVPPPEENKPLKCAAGMCSGTVNGVEICVKCNSYETVNQNTTTTTNADGSKTETSQLGDTWCGLKECKWTVETTTVTRDAAGNIISGPATTKEEKTEDKQSYCEKNPESKQCKETEINEASGGETCAAEPICQGDAIQCMMVKQQWKTRCIFDTENAMSALGGQLIAGSDPDAHLHPAALANRTQIDLTNSIDQSRFLSGGGLQDKTFSAMGQTFVIPFSRMNSWLQMFGNILVAITMILAARIVVGGTN